PEPSGRCRPGAGPGTGHCRAEAKGRSQPLPLEAYGRHEGRLAPRKEGGGQLPCGSETTLVCFGEEPVHSNGHGEPTVYLRLQCSVTEGADSHSTADSKRITQPPLGSRAEEDRSGRIGAKSGLR